MQGIVMELLRQELFNRITLNRRYNENHALAIYRHLVEGINALHRIGIIHRDLKVR